MIAACPFCGSNGNLVVLKRIGMMHRVVCARCLTEGPASHNESGGIRGWNERAIDEHMPEIRYLLANIIGSGDGAGRNPQLMVNAANRIAKLLGEPE